MLAALPADAFSQGDAYASVTPSWFAAVSDQSANVSQAGGAVLSVASTPSAVASQNNGLTVAIPLASIATATEARVAGSEWIIRLSSRALESVRTVADAAAYLGATPLGLEVVEGLGLPGQVLVRTSAAVGAVEHYFAGNTDIASFSRNGITTPTTVPNDPLFSRLYALRNTGQTGGPVGADIDATAAWNVTTGSQAVFVGVIDTGIDYTHPDLAANIWTNPGEIAGNGFDDDANGFVDDVHGYDFANDDGDPIDDHGHGTHVSGTIGAVGDNGTGVTGVSWNVSLMALKFLDASGAGWDSDAIRAVNYATMMRTAYDVNVRVTNNSWGGGSYDAGLLDAINVGGAAGIMFVAAAGNSGQNADTSPSYPAAYDSPAIVSVAATDSTDSLAWFSNYGSTSVDVAAPGVNIISTLPGNRYGMLSGTSMATPHVSGVAALALAVDPSLTVAQLKGRLLDNVDPIPGLVGRTVSGGRLNAATVVNSLVMADPTVTITSSKAILKAGATSVITFRLSEPATNFTAADVSVTGGVLSGFAGAATTFTATFTPTAGYDGAGTIAVDAGSFTDAAGNPNVAGMLASAIRIDTAPPTMVIAASKGALKAGETAVLTFTLSETPVSFTAAMVTVAGGSLSGFGGSGAVYTATFTPTANFSGSGTVTVSAGRCADAAGNDNVASSLTPSLAIDTKPPALWIATNRRSLKADETAVVTFTLSESVADFTVDDVTAVGGVLSNFAGSGVAYSATFTPTAGFSATGTLNVTPGKFTDAAGNGNTKGTLSPPIGIDARPPTVTITSSLQTVKFGTTAVLTFRLSESTTTFTVADVIVTGGTLSNFAGTGVAYSATFTPIAGLVGTGTISVDAGAFTDSIGNPSLAGSLAAPLRIDMIVPTIAIAVDKTAVKAGESAVLTFTLSEAPASFTAGMVTVTGGTLSGFAGTGATYTARFIPTANFTGSGTVVVNAGRFKDTAGNGNVAGALAPSIAIDTKMPAVAIASSRSIVKSGETATLTFTLSESASDFVAGDLTVAGGTLSDFTGSGTLYTAIFTPTVGFMGSGAVTVTPWKFTDAAGNGNVQGVLSPSMLVDTKAPTLTITSSLQTLKAGTAAGITFKLSESTTTFTAADVTVTGGTLSNFAGTGSTYTATFTPTPDLVGAGTVTVAAGTFTDAAGNANVASSLASALRIDLIAPTIVITADKTALKAGETALLRFSLSEVPASFKAAMVTVAGGTLSSFAGSGTLYTAKFTPTAGFAGVGMVTVAAGKFTDVAGNASVAGSLSAAIAIDTILPTVAIAVSQSSLKAGQSAMITFTLSESAADFAATDVTVTRGTLSNFAGSGTTYTATFMPTAGFTGTGTATVAAGKFTDAAGNANAAAALPGSFAITA